MNPEPWILYGAYGFTGELVAREAVRRGLRPILAGRRQAPLAALANELDLAWRAFPLDEPETLDRELANVSLILHCAGPFRWTSGPVVAACLRVGCDYLDVTGEIDVFESIFRLHDAARSAGSALLPGVGLDVVPTDCLAAHLKESLPSGDHLDLALAMAGGAASRGTLTTMIEGFPNLGAERVAGTIVARPVAFDAREIEFPHRRLWAMTIPWGDLATAFRTTGIPNIRVYMGASQRRVRRLRALAPLLPALGSRPVKRSLQWWVRRRVTGPGPQARAAARSYFWGSIRNESGTVRTATLETPEGYTLTAWTAVEIASRVLAGDLRPGAWTPAGAFGPGLIKVCPGVRASW